MDNTSETFNSLTAEPKMLYLLWQLFEDSKNIHLPQFMDTGALSRKLDKLNLVKIQDQKHIHDPILIITPLGKNTVELNYGKIVQLFNGIPLDSESHFNYHFYTILKSLDVESLNPDIASLIDLFGIPKINEDFNRGKVKMKLKDIKILKNTTHNIEVQFQLMFLCSQCQTNQSTIFKITYNSEEYKVNPAEISIICKVCSHQFFIDAYLSRIRFSH